MEYYTWVLWNHTIEYDSNKSHESQILRINYINLIPLLDNNMLISPLLSYRGNVVCSTTLIIDLYVSEVFLIFFMLWIVKPFVKDKYPRPNIFSRIFKGLKLWPQWLQPMWNREKNIVWELHIISHKFRGKSFMSWTTSNIVDEDYVFICYVSAHQDSLIMASPQTHVKIIIQQSNFILDTSQALPLSNLLNMVGVPFPE